MQIPTNNLKEWGKSIDEILRTRRFLQILELLKFLVNLIHFWAMNVMDPDRWIQTFLSPGSGSRDRKTSTKIMGKSYRIRVLMILNIARFWNYHLQVITLYCFVSTLEGSISRVWVKIYWIHHASLKMLKRSHFAERCTVTTWLRPASLETHR